ncbi:unnamed protein product, partial [Vitis vinifera]
MVANSTKITVSNVSSIDLVLNNGERLNCWIDYEAGSKRLEVRLSKFGDIRPVSPFISHPIDLSEMWNEDEVYVGFSSSSGNSSQTCVVYSWSFNTRPVPHWMHSQPLDPKTLKEDMRPQTVHEKRACLLRVLAALIFGTGCGALGAFIALFLCTIFGNRRPVVPVPEELCVVNSRSFCFVLVFLWLYCVVVIPLSISKCTLCYIFPDGKGLSTTACGCFQINSQKTDHSFAILST